MPVDCRYIWGTAITNEPRHSELPALRDLLLSAGGWQSHSHAHSLIAWRWHATDLLLSTGGWQSISQSQPCLCAACTRTGGWKELKRDAAIKADEEGARRKRAAVRPTWLRSLATPLAAIPRHVRRLGWPSNMHPVMYALHMPCTCASV